MLNRLNSDIYRKLGDVLNRVRGSVSVLCAQNTVSLTEPSFLSIFLISPSFDSLCFCCDSSVYQEIQKFKQTSRRPQGAGNGQIRPNEAGT